MSEIIITKELSTFVFSKNRDEVVTGDSECEWI